MIDNKKLIEKWSSLLNSTTKTCRAMLIESQEAPVNVVSPQNKNETN